jgi:hypothetical protein
MTPRGGARAGAGARRSLLDGRTICVYLDAPTMDKIESICTSHQTTRSGAVRLLVRLAIARLGKGDNGPDE